jgi:hypothetical protein
LLTFCYEGNRDTGILYYLNVTAHYEGIAAWAYYTTVRAEGGPMGMVQRLNRGQMNKGGRTARILKWIASRTK